MTLDVDYRGMIERELGLCLDLETRDLLLEALRLGPGSRAWSEALGIVAVREMARATLTSPRRVRAERIERRARRGEAVRILGDIAIIATIAGALVIAILGLALAVWRCL